MILTKNSDGSVFMPIEFEKALALGRWAERSDISYHFGSKVEPLSSFNFRQVDCSGYVRWILYHCYAAVNKLDNWNFPDGSATQHEYIEGARFKAEDYTSGFNRDNCLRIAFLAPVYSHGKMIRPGHVLLILNGRTLESHGGQGPDSRIWGSLGFMRECYIFRLTANPLTRK